LNAANATSPYLSQGPPLQVISLQPGARRRRAAAARGKRRGAAAAPSAAFLSASGIDFIMISRLRLHNFQNLSPS
jgi:hypothetical protein